MLKVGAVVQLVEYRTRNQEVAGSTHTRSTASNLEQVANLLRGDYGDYNTRKIIITVFLTKPSLK